MLETDFPERTWSDSPDRSVVFSKTSEEFGGLSNMSGGYPVEVNGTPIRTIEALYQAMRFPDNPEVQELILAQPSPMGAKAVSRDHLTHTRPDWNQIRIDLMAWCLRVKLLQHQDSFGSLLASTGTREIVEFSRKDAFWGAMRAHDDLLMGRNVLGLLLMKLRSELNTPARCEADTLAAPEGLVIKLGGHPVVAITRHRTQLSDTAKQSSLFDS